MHAKAITLLVLPCLLLLFGCGGNGTTAEVASVSGRVVAGPVSGANVTILPLLNTGALGAPLGAGTTGTDGFFSVGISSHIGPAVVLARGGEFVDEATGNTVVADQLEMASLVMLTGDVGHTAHVTVATTIATRRAMVLATDPAVNALDALRNGVAMVEEYYGIVGILDTLPADLTAGDVPPGPEAEYGALNAGFSQLAADEGIQLWSLITALAEDGSDGVFDGKFYAGPLYVGPTEDLAWTTGGADLIASIDAFVAGPRNASGLTAADLSVDGAIERHVEEDPDMSPCILQPRIGDIVPAVGPVGETVDVMLYGQFPELASVSLVVTFDGVPATIVQRTEDWGIKVVAPVRLVAGKVDIAVSCANTHVYGTAVDGFEYYVPNLTPVITGVTPDGGPAVGGTLIEVTGQNFDPTAIVEVGGIQARTIARLGRTVLIAAAPSGEGTVDITVRQADTTSAAAATTTEAFSYFEEGTGEEPTEASLDGNWKFYALGHWYPDTVTLLHGDLTFTGGTFTESASAWVATPLIPTGTVAPETTSGPYRAFADGTLWLGPTDQTFASRAFLSPERDVFIITNDTATDAPVWLGAGIRRASGMSNASLTGTWYVALFSHAYAAGDGPRMVSSAWGTVEFDGAGHGSAGLITTECPAGATWEDARGTVGAPLTYVVAADGTLTVTVENGEESPIVYQGSLTQARDLGIGVAVSGVEAQFLMMVPSPVGISQAHVQGSWYGAGLSYGYDTERGNYFGGETTRMLIDGNGFGISEVNINATSDADENEGLHREVHDGETLCDTTGILNGGPEELFGFVGASRRFVLFVPANLDAAPDVDVTEFMGVSLFVRRPATFSSWTLSSASYNAVGISTEYKSPGIPLSLDEENTSFLTKLVFDPAVNVIEQEESDLVGLVREPAGERVQKWVNRWGSSLSLSYWDDFPEFRGPYAVFGDGRILMSLESTMSMPTANAEEILNDVVGEITGNADVIVLRNSVNQSASSLIVLARDGSPTLNGQYNAAGLGFTLLPEDWEYAAASLGEISFDAGRRSLLRRHGLDRAVLLDGWGHREPRTAGR